MHYVPEGGINSLIGWANQNLLPKTAWKWKSLDPDVRAPLDPPMTSSIKINKDWNRFLYVICPESVGVKFDCEMCQFSCPVKLASHRNNTFWQMRKSQTRNPCDWAVGMERKNTSLFTRTDLFPSTQINSNLTGQKSGLIFYILVLKKKELFISS